VKRTSPRAGGEAGKFGARFEELWTVKHLLDVLLGRADAVTVEPVDPLGDAVEFLVDRNGEIEGHQCKRQDGDSANWTILRLDDKGVLTAAKAYVDLGRRYSFVSTIPSIPLGTLIDAARRAEDYPAFSLLIAGNDGQRAAFDTLAGKWGGPVAAWSVLRKTRVHKPDEGQLEEMNATVAQLLFEGPPGPATATLGKIALKRTGVPLTADGLWREMRDAGIQQNPLWDANTVADLVVAQTRRYLADAQARLFRPPACASGDRDHSRSDPQRCETRPRCWRRRRRQIRGRGAGRRHARGRERRCSRASSRLVHGRALRAPAWRGARLALIACRRPCACCGGPARRTCYRPA
jgi:hypothetical protein